MGNNQPQKKKIPVINKTQLQVACTKSRIHLELMRDRKNAEIIKGQRQLVAKLKSPSRNKIEQLLIAERVTNGLKYAQACNQLASYAATLKSQAHYIAENVANPQKMQPWLGYVFTLQFAADRMGLSSLNDFRHAIRSLYDPQTAIKYCNQDIVLLLSPTPTPQEINLYMVQMSERNNIPLEEINMIGHKFTKEWNQPPQWDPHFLDIKKQLADQMAKNIQANSQGSNVPGGQGFSGQGQGGNEGSTGFGGGNQGFNGNGQGQGFGGQQGGGYGSKGQGGMGQQKYDFKEGKQQINPYKGVSSMNHGPQYYQPGEYQPSNNSSEKPHEFPSWDDMMKATQNNNHKLNVYPEVDPKQYKGSEYKPIHNPFTPPEEQENHNSPTLSQIMRDFDKKN